MCDYSLVSNHSEMASHDAVLFEVARAIVTHFKVELLDAADLFDRNAVLVAVVELIRLGCGALRPADAEGLRASEVGWLDFRARCADVGEVRNLGDFPNDHAVPHVVRAFEQ